MLMSLIVGVGYAFYGGTRIGRYSVHYSLDQFQQHIGVPE